MLQYKKVDKHSSAKVKIVQQLPKKGTSVQYYRKQIPQTAVVLQQQYSSAVKKIHLVQFSAAVKKVEQYGAVVAMIMVS